MSQAATVPFTIEHPERNVAVVRLPVSGERWEQWFLLRGDVHWDNPQCDRTLERKHLDEAKERDAGIIDVGDLFCCMQGKYDPRKSMDGVRHASRAARASLLHHQRVRGGRDDQHGERGRRR